MANIRRALAVFLSAGLALSGCAGGGGDDASGTTEIVIWEQRDPQERAFMETILAEYTETHPEITFAVVHHDTENLRTLYQTAAVSGGGPDLVYGPSDQVGPFSALSIIQPLDELLPETIWTRFLPGALDTLDGHLWALPDQVGNHLNLLLNTDLVSKDPETLDELVALAKPLTTVSGAAEDRRYGLAFEFNEPYWMIPFLTAFGGWVMDADRNPTLDTPACVRALAFLKNLRDGAQVVPRECSYQLMDTLFKEGKVAMILNGPWSFEDYKKAGVPFRLARIPRAAPGQPWAAPMIGSKGYSVNAGLDPKKRDAVLALLDHLTSVQITARMAVSLGVLPSTTEAFEDPALKDNELLAASRRQWEAGRRMPVVVEMRAIWDAMRPNMQAVMNGSKSPESAARDMQAEAVRNIAILNQ